MILSEPQLLLAALEHATDVVFTLDRRGRFTFVSRVWPGLLKRDVIGRPLSSFLNPPAKRIWAARLREVYRTGKRAAFETHYTDAEGRDIWWSHEVAPIKAGRRLAGAAVISRDCTRNKRLEEKLESSERFWRRLLEQSADFIIVVDGRLRIRYINRYARGFKAEGVIGRRFEAFIAQESRTQAVRAVRSVLRTGRPTTYESRGQGDDGKPRWYSTRCAAIIDERGERCVVLAARDNTEEKTIRARFEGVFNASRLAIDYTDVHGNLLEANPAMQRLLGYSEAELRRMRIGDYTPREYAAGDRAIIRALLRTGRPHEFEKEWVRKDGTRVPVRLTTFVVPGPDGKIEGLAAMIEDITERRRMERELIEAGAREQSKLGRDLHDTLGQTLTGLSLLAKSLRSRLEGDGPAAADASRLVELSSQAVKQARGLARGLLPAELQSAGLREALVQLAANAQALFGVRCELICPPNIPLPDEPTAVQLYRIAQEAVHNAAKHARSKAGVSIRLSANGSRLRLSVLDRGVGIPAPRRRGKGLGLGIMAYRARTLGATLKISRLKRGGTIVTVDCPSALHRKK